MDLKRTATTTQDSNQDPSKWFFTELQKKITLETKEASIHFKCFKILMLSYLELVMLKISIHVVLVLLAQSLCGNTPITDVFQL